MEISNKVESFFRDLLACVQIGKIYTSDHPRYKEYIDKAYQDVSAILSEREDFIIGIIGDEIAFEKDIFFDLSKQVKVVVSYLKSKGIERMVFYRALSRDELDRFVGFLTSPFDAEKIAIDKYLVSQGIQNIMVGKIKTSAPAQDSLKESIDYIKNYQHSGQQAEQMLTDMLDAKQIDALELKFTIISIMENLVGRYVEFFKLAVVKEYDLLTFSHVLNVSILSMYFASKLGYSHNDCIEIGIAGLFHDIGKVYISRKIIQKTDKLTDAEFSSVRSHTVLGAEILLKYVETLGVLPVIVAFEHHIKYDMKGYPKVPFTRPMHITSQIVSLCDVYDALAQRRSYKRDYPPELIFDIMQRERGALFDPVLLDKFFDALGLWPVGTIVQLSDRSVAVVRSQNQGKLRMPNVEIVPPTAEKKIIDLSQTKSLTITSSLNPLNEGKDYVKYV